MSNDFNINRFRQLRAQAEDVLSLKHRTEELLTRRSLQSFDGFGHFLDVVLGDDSDETASLADTVHLPQTVIDQLRASELDPYTTVFEHVAYLGYLLGINDQEFSRLVHIDHVRFARYSGAVVARSPGEDEKSDTEHIVKLWRRFEEDRATSL